MPLHTVLSDSDKGHPGLNFSAQNDVRVGLQGEEFYKKMQLKTLTSFWAALGFQGGGGGGKMV